MVSLESLLIALLGTFLGIVLGLVGGVRPVADLPARTSTPPRSTSPTSWLIAFCIMSAVFGLLASIFPAWRASRLNVLDAVSHD